MRLNPSCELPHKTAFGYLQSSQGIAEQILVCTHFIEVDFSSEWNQVRSQSLDFSLAWLL